MDRNWAFRRLALSSVCVLAPLFLTLSAQAQPLAKSDIVKRGRAATALVQRHPSVVTGTAFCVHPAGYFVTFERVYFGLNDDAEVTLILDPGLKSQRTLMARMVRRDKNLGLGLLHADGAKDLPTLPFGSAESLAELAELYAFSYPAGDVQGWPKSPEYPGVNVLVGPVTALNRKAGELMSIELKAGLKFGAFGCPVLDDKGTLVGMINLGGPTSRAVPINRIVNFLAAPDLQFAPPTITRGNQHQALDFQVRVTSIIPPAKPLITELILRAGLEPEQQLTMERKGDKFHRSAIPLPTPIARRLELNAQFTMGSLAGIVTNSEVTVGTEKVKLSEIRRVQLGPKSSVTLHNGKSLEGMPTGLDKIEMQIGGQTFSVNLGQALAIRVQTPAPAAVVESTVITRSDDGKEVARLQSRLPIRGVNLFEPADPSTIEIRPPVLAAEKVIVNLPDIASDVRVGGGGRYLVLHLPKLKKLAIFDVNAAAIKQYIPLPDEKIVYAASLDKLILGLVEKGIVERWNLTTGEKEFAQTFPDPIQFVLIGSASNGPLVVNGAFYDLATLQRLPISTPRGGPNAYSPVSAEGTVFGAWVTHIYPNSSLSHVLQADELKRFDAGDHGHIVPGPDGRVIYTRTGPISSQMTGLANHPFKTGFSIPAVHGDFFLSLTPQGKPGTGGLSVHLLGQEKPIHTDVKFDHSIRFDGWGPDRFGPWKRVFLIPQAKVVVIFPQTNDRLELRRLDVQAILEKSGLDYLLVTSRPPTVAKRGTAYSYQVAAATQKGKVTYRLNAGPKGMEVSPTGKLTWTVPMEYPDSASDVILTVRSASGQEAFHTFVVRVREE